MPFIEFFTNINYLFSLLIGLGIIRFFLNGPRTTASSDMKDKIVIITGCSAGIGKETARDLLNKGAKVVFACRDKTKTLSVINQITNESNRNNAFFMQLNLASFKSVAEFVNEFSKKFDRLDSLINNAGVFIERFLLTEDNLETDIQTNHISHFALTGLLLKFLKKSDDPRVINVSSEAHRFAEYYEDYFTFTPENFRLWKMYANSKAANVFFSEALKDLSANKDSQYNKILSASLHPGAVYTEIARADGKVLFYKIIAIIGKPVMWVFFKNEEMGAQTTLHCCYISREEFVNGGYYYDCRVGRKEENMRKNDLERRIHKVSYDAIMKSSSFVDFQNDNDFKTYMEFFRKRF